MTSSIASIKDILSPGWREDFFHRWDIVPDEEFWPPVYFERGLMMRRA